jgi:hypothetical protein
LAFQTMKRLSNEMKGTPNFMKHGKSKINAEDLLKQSQPAPGQSEVGLGSALAKTGPANEVIIKPLTPSYEERSAKGVC